MFSVSVPVLSVQTTVVALERLDRGQAAHDRPAVGHRAGTECERARLEPSGIGAGTLIHCAANYAHGFGSTPMQ